MRGGKGAHPMHPLVIHRLDFCLSPVNEFGQGLPLLGGQARGHLHFPSCKACMQRHHQHRQHCTFSQPFLSAMPA